MPGTTVSNAPLRIRVRGADREVISQGGGRALGRILDDRATFPVSYWEAHTGALEKLHSSQRDRGGFLERRCRRFGHRLEFVLCTPIRCDHPGFESIDDDDGLTSFPLQSRVLSSQKPRSAIPTYSTSHSLSSLVCFSVSSLSRQC